MRMGPKFVILSAYLCLVSCPLVFPWLSDGLPSVGELMYHLQDSNPNGINFSADTLAHGLPVPDPVAIENKLDVLASKNGSLSDDDRIILKIALHNLGKWREDSMTKTVNEMSLNRVHTWLYLKKCLDDAETLGLTVFKKKMMSDGWAKADRSKYESVEEFVEDMIEIHWAKRLQRWLFIFENVEDVSLASVKNFASQVTRRFKSPKRAAYEIDVFGVQVNRCIRVYSGCPESIVGENVGKIENEVLANLLFSTLTANVFELRF